MRGRMCGCVHAAVVAALVGAGCRQGEVPLARPPSLADAGVQRCGLAGGEVRPLVVEWSGADRGSLELRMQSGLVVVRQDGCELAVLPDCAVSGGYTYAGFTRKQDSVTISDVDELYAQIPVGAERYEATLVKHGALQVDMALVGMYRDAARRAYVRGDLAGRCEGATHVVAGAQVGAFSFYAGARTELGGEAVNREVLNTDGVIAACAAASLEDPAPPRDCGALLRLELSPVLADPPAVEVAEAPVVEAPPRARAPRRELRRVAGRGEIDDVAQLAFTIGGVLSTVGLAGLAMIGGGRKRAHDHAEALASLEPDEWGIGQQQRLKSARSVAYAGGWMAAVAGVLGLTYLFIGVGVVRKDRMERLRAARWRVEPAVTRAYVGVDVAVRF